MMGGLLEALLLARLLKDPDKDKIFKSKAAPRDETGKALELKKWGLNDYLNVAHEVHWITETANAVSAVMRDYRNYIHPYKQHSQGVHLTPEDAWLLWDVFRSIVRQVLTPSPVL